MAAGDCEISTESEDAQDFAEDSTAGKLLPSDAANGSSDSGSDRDDESELGKVRLRRKRVEWETVETCDEHKGITKLADHFKVEHNRCSTLKCGFTVEHLSLPLPTPAASVYLHSRFPSF